MARALRPGSLLSVRAGNPLEVDPADRLALERELWVNGYRRIAGVDEAGRGPLAGPVVAAAVLLPPEWVEQGMPEELLALNDSKQLTESAREQFFELLIGASGVCYAVVAVEAERVDALNILRATGIAMRNALDQLASPPDHILIDGLRVKDLPWPQTPVVHGDALSYSIAAASVLAKVTRDRFMTEQDQAHPGYGFARHKGYGTPEHLEALKKLGPCPLHRRTFAPLRPWQGELFQTV